MTSDELLSRLERLRDDAASVDTDVAAVLAVLVRMMRASDDMSDLTEWCLEAERRAIERKDRLR